MEELESFPSDCDFFESFAAFEAGMTDEMKDRSWSTRLKAFLKKDLPTGDDGRLHGEARQCGKMIDASVNFAAWTRNRCSTADTWTDDVLDGGGLRHGTIFDGTFPYTLEKLAPLADLSICARRLYMSRYLSELGQVQMLDGDTVAAVRSLASAYRFSELPVQWNADLRDEALSCCNHLVSADEHSSRTRADALFVRSHLHILGRDLMTALDDLHAAQRLLPKDSHLYTYEADVCNTLNRRQEALMALDKAKSLGSHNLASIYFIRGCILQNCVEDAGAIVQARQNLEEFVRLADEDERKVCEAHYHLAMICVQESKLGEARRQYDKGVEAESRRLACFCEPKSNYRRSAATLLEAIHPCGFHECALPGQMYCSCKTVRYCGPVCQKKDWKLHKGVCKSRRSGAKSSISSDVPASTASAPERDGDPGGHRTPKFVQELRDTIGSVGQGVVEEDDVLGPLVRGMTLLRQELKMKIADLFVVKALLAFCDTVESDPSRRHFVVDLACPRDPGNLLMPTRNAHMALLAPEVLMNHVFVSLPLWDHRRALRSGAVSKGIFWFLEAHSVMNTPSGYDAHDWHKTTEHGAIDSTSVTNSLSTVRGFWADSVSLVGKLGADIARKEHGAIVLRVLRSTGNASYARSIRELAGQQLPANCFTLWIREDVPPVCPCFKPLRESMSLVSQLLDYGKPILGRRLWMSDGDSDDEDAGSKPGRLPGMSSHGSPQTSPSTTLTCSQCGEQKARTSFSNSQMAKKKKSSSHMIKCTLCA